VPAIRYHLRLRFRLPAPSRRPDVLRDTVGLNVVLSRLKEYRSRFGDYWEPAPLLERLAAEGRGFYSEAAVHRCKAPEECDRRSFKRAENRMSRSPTFSAPSRACGDEIAVSDWAAHAGAHQHSRRDGDLNDSSRRRARGKGIAVQGNDRDRVPDVVARERVLRDSIRIGRFAASP